MREFISPWGPYIIQYIKYKKLCGYKCEKIENIASLFERYYHDLGINEALFTRDVVEPFLFLHENEQVTNQKNRVSMLRQFGKYLFDNDIFEDVYIVPIGYAKVNFEYIPYIYSHDELVRIIEYMDNLGKHKSHLGVDAKPNTYNCVRTAIKILITTGMRCGEVLQLKRNEVDLDNQVFVIRVAKNNNQRIVPFSDSLKQVLIDYLENTPYQIDEDDYFLSPEKGIGVTKTLIQYYFYKSLKHIGIKHERGKGPRIHDFRHTYATMALAKLQRECDNVNLNLSYLSAYLGHKSIHETQKYVWLTPGLFEDTRAKMTDYSSFIATIFQGENYYD